MRCEGDALNRRTMLKGMACSAAAVAGGTTSWAAVPAGKRWFKIGACEWSLGKGDWTALDVAKEVGLDGIQVNMGRVANDMHLRKPEVQQAYRDAAQRTGLEMASLAIGEMNSVPLKSDPRAAQWLADSLDVCKALNMKLVMPAFFGKGDLDMAKTEEIDHVVGVIRDVAPRAEKAGIAIGLENYLSAEDNMRIVERIGSPAVKVYYDVGNSTDKGRDVYREIRLLGQLICEFHAKDGKFLLGQGRINFRKVRAAIDDIGYSGWIHLEAARPNGLQQDYAAQAKFLREIFPQRS